MAMNKDQLVKNVAELAKDYLKEVGIEDLRVTQKLTTAFVEATFDAVADALAAGENVKVVNFGTFEIRERAARKGRNPQTGEEMDIDASVSVGFKPSKSGLKSRLPQA